MKIYRTIRHRRQMRRLQTFLQRMPQRQTHPQQTLRRLKAVKAAAVRRLRENNHVSTRISFAYRRKRSGLGI